ncbi:MarR family winged helix-turn-helix transcriptional regulator [Pseudactinotalea suaedae]|uniref:MarR family winged helix-turn-helix transcriptional regulator n=1 Tax=Pseudactinotalea suaedae TaxID=1524924 RepID=UPI0019D58826|nr:MarR family transcriptional regulator [Pseudactinotalea suaedae]
MATQWLTPEERQAWAALTGLLIKLPTALDAAMARESGFTFFEYRVLSMLAEEADGTLRMSTLADRTNGSLSRLSHVVRRLEDQGMVRREGAPEDRRATNAILTEEGRRRVEATAPGHVDFVRDLVIDGATPDELETFARFGEGVLDRLESVSG